ncbi:MAG TPA: MarR family transcriptional regulator [Pseudonocardiaceae bacterium]|jgi:DNA-binding MarR family transcriptional regulator|nr:MarR family transcriptional regulator [Pseudonocardiaceae bacterium]
MPKDATQPARPRPAAAATTADRTEVADLGIVDGLVQLSFVVQGVLGQVATERGLSVVQLRLLGVLRDRTPGMRELAQHLGLDKSSMTGLVDRAERRGLVRRSPAPHDGRVIQVSLTPAGHELVRATAVEADREILALTAHLTDEQRAQLSQLASVLVAGSTVL